ncbi:MAG: winged helix-turn-helix domain-containing protein [Hespellia sp.]|nr:winged helix-turn-helix domain-containing protein [Hespellia sp.]
MAQDDASIQRLVQHLMAGLPDSTIYTVQQDYLCFGELEIYIQERRVLIAERQIPLSAREYDFLVLLASHPRWIFSKEQLCDYLWHDPPEDADNAVSCLVFGLRKKLSQYSRKEYIHTIRSAGYFFQP